MLRLAAALALLVSACSGGETQTEAPPAAPAPTPAPVVAPADLKALEAAHDWQNEPGASLNAAWAAGVIQLLSPMSRNDAIGAITGAGFECTYGEAHEDYPEPMAVCTRSFATRACQMDWEIWSTADKGRVTEAGGDFKRDCVGTDRDWPDPVKSAIDDQLAPMMPPQ